MDEVATQAAAGAAMTWKEILQSVWAVLNYPIIVLDGNPLSVGKLLVGIGLLCGGYILSKRASHIVEDRLLRRLDIEQSLRYTFGRFIFYFFLLLCTLFTLNTLSVPITIFTVIGGALAVGIGFGSQNIVNNFISGILVLVTRPIRVGDQIEVGSVSGTIENIGIRATHLRTGRNSVMIVPNTVFIENTLTNWTMSGEVTVSFNVGVGYETDVHRFIELALGVVRETEFVLALPAPWVRLNEFGDNALIFELGFSIKAEKFPDRNAILSDVRIRTFDAIKANRIHLPFPQRELHIAVKDAQRMMSQV
jgi:potassium efflux system protein